MLGNELASFVEGLYETMFVRGQQGSDFYGFKEGHGFIYRAILVSVVQDVERIGRLWVIVFYTLHKIL